MYGSKTLVWKEKERSKIRAEQINNFKAMSRVSKIDTRMGNERIRKLVGIRNRVNQVIN